MIRHIEPYEHIRIRPQMYFKTLFEEKTLDSLPLEVIQYAIDLKCTSIILDIYPDHFSVEFNAGISLETYHDYSRDITQAEAVLLKFLKFEERKKYTFKGLELDKYIGLVRVNATAEWCKLLTYSNGQKGEFLFKEGKTETRTICGSDEKKNYTKLSVKPDITIFPDFTINPTTLQEKIDEVHKKLNGVDIQLQIHK